MAYWLTGIVDGFLSRDPWNSDPFYLEGYRQGMLAVMFARNRRYNVLA